MTGIDTNVLVRYLVQDDAEQARKATYFITNECSTDDTGLINRIVLCELVWVLETAYDYPRNAVAMALEKILRTAQFTVEDHQEAWLAFRDYQRSSRSSRSPRKKNFQPLGLLLASLRGTTSFGRTTSFFWMNHVSELTEYTGRSN